MTTFYCVLCGGLLDRESVTTKDTVWDLTCSSCKRISSERERVYKYLVGRRLTIESSIAAERLAGDEFKEACERCALAEITALEAWITNSHREIK